MFHSNFNSNDLTRWMTDQVNRAIEEKKAEIQRTQAMQTRRRTSVSSTAAGAGKGPVMVRVSSSWIQAAGYDGQARRLHVQVRSTGKVYVLYRVPEEVYGEFMAASSKGRYFDQHLKGKYSIP